MADANAIDTALRAGVARGDVSGVVAMAGDRAGVLYQGAFGSRGVQDAAPMTLDTVFAIFSMTKAITSALAMQLVEEGKVGLDDPLGHLRPHLGRVQVLEGFDAGGAPRLRAPKRPVTLRHLLTHTSGFAHHIWNADVLRYMQAMGMPPARSGKLAVLDMALMFDPGEQWAYGISTDWVGRVIEAARNRPLPDVFAERMFKPLGMVDTGYIPGPSQAARRAAMHQRGADGKLAQMDWPVNETPEFFGGAGGLFSTAPDYLRFLRMLLRGGELDGARILKPETVALMGENHIGDVLMGPMRTAQPAQSHDVEFWPGMRKNWGLGFMRNTARVPGGRGAGSLAWAGLANLYFWLDPAAGVGGVIMTQVLPFCDPPVLGLLEALERGVYA